MGIIKGPHGPGSLVLAFIVGLILGILGTILFYHPVPPPPYPVESQPLR